MPSLPVASSTSTTRTQLLSSSLVPVNTININDLTTNPNIVQENYWTWSGLPVTLAVVAVFVSVIVIVTLAVMLVVLKKRAQQGAKEREFQQGISNQAYGKS